MRSLEREGLSLLALAVVSLVLSVVAFALAICR